MALTRKGLSDVFLATTAQEEFWDDKGSLVFLGEWCTRYSRRTAWQNRGAMVLPSVWANPAKAQAAYHEAGRIYEDALAGLSGALNRLHGSTHGPRFWRILVGPWLRWFTHVVMDRHSTILAAIERFPAFRTLGLAESSFVTPRNTLEFVQLNKDDAYNLQLFTQILAHEGRDPPRAPLSFSPTPLENSIPEPGWKPAVRRAARQSLYAGSRATARSKAVIARSSYFTFKNETKLALRAQGRLRSIDHLPPPKLEAAPDPQLRAGLRLSSGNSSFERLHGALVRRELPTCFVEGFSRTADQVRDTYPSPPSAIMSANAWYFDEPFKFWAADANEKGTRLLGVQHGGNYGSWGMHADFDHELRMTDTFFSWGWNDAGPARVVPMPSPMLLGRVPVPADSDGDILLAASVQPRYVFQFPITPAFFSDYIDRQMRFMAALGPLQERLRVRLHAEDQGWDLRARLKDRFPNVRLDPWTVPLLKSLADSSLFVCDHLSTTFVESLAADHPTLLFWPVEAWPLRAPAIPFYDALRKAGILWEDPEDAAAQVGAVISDPDGWWQAPERKEARRQFCQRFGLTAPGARRRWAEEISKAARKGRGAK